jgi:hypothetical protein
MWGSSYFGTSYFDADYFGSYTPAETTATPLDPQWLMLLVGRPIVAASHGTGPYTFSASIEITPSGQWDHASVESIQSGVFFEATIENTTTFSYASVESID